MISYCDIILWYHAIWYHVKLKCLFSNYIVLVSIQIFFIKYNYFLLVWYHIWYHTWYHIWYHIWYMISYVISFIIWYHIGYHILYDIIYDIMHIMILWHLGLHHLPPTCQWSQCRPPQQPPSDARAGRGPHHPGQSLGDEGPLGQALWWPAGSEI